MSLKMESLENGKVRLEFENVVSVWNILKYLSSAVYLKHFVVEKYEGGNTQVPEEAWKEEGILYNRLPDNNYYFPYESIGFVLNDSVASLTVYVLENQKDIDSYRTSFEMRFEVCDTDSAVLEMSREHLVTFVSLYLMSMLRVGFDSAVLKSVDAVVKTLLGSRVTEIEYIPDTLTFGVNGMQFVTRVGEAGAEKVESRFYRIECRKKCRKTQITEKQVVSFGYLKKKILSKNKYLPFAYYGLIVLFWILLFFLKRSLFVAGVVLVIVVYAGWRIFRKFAWKLYRNAPDDDREPPLPPSA
jgi:hypothetical protein